MQLLKIVNELTTKNKEIINDDKVKMTSAGGVAVIADSTQPIADEDDRKGWLFKKLAADASKFNYYIYGDTASSHPFTLAEVTSLYMCCSVDKWENSASVPFINIYTKPTGSGDASWYKSRVTYSINMGNQKIMAGEHINLWCKSRPDLKNDKRYVELETISSVGTAAADEQLYMIALSSDSASLLDTKILVSEGGYELGEIKRNIQFVV